MPYWESGFSCWVNRYPLQADKNNKISKMRMLILYHGQEGGGQVTKEGMFKKLDFKSLNYKDLDRYDAHDLKRDQLKSFYETFDFLDLIQKWPLIVGEKMAKVSSPVRLRQEALVIMTKHSVYSQELSFLAEEIKRETFKVFPHLRPIILRLVFQTQENFFDELKSEESKKVPSPKLHPQSPQVKILRLEAEKVFAHIDDPDLKSTMISLFIQSRV